MGLSEKEIDSLINKIREKFKNYAKRYKTGWFNIEGFNDRLKIALQKRMNLEGFLLAEVSNLEELKEKHDKEEAEKNKGESPFTKHVNQIIEENTRRISKYKEIKFHPLAGMEISHFYGAVSEFSQNIFSILWTILKEQEYRGVLDKFEQELVYLAIPVGNKHPKRIEDHGLILSRREGLEIDIEKDKNDYLKVCAFVLHDIIEFTEKLLEIRDSALELPLQLESLDSGGKQKAAVIKNFKGLTGYGAIIRVKDFAQQIVKDFRLDAFRRKGI